MELDGLGSWSSRACWNWSIRDEAFGATAPNEDPDQDGQAFVFNLRFPGQRYDAASGLNYNYFRDYEPATGRYVQSDPIGLEGGISTYSYAGSSPFSLADPSGLDACTILFPDYPIEYAEGKKSTWLGGHGGVLTYDSNGATRYFEYGRYSPTAPGVVGVRLPAEDGNVRRVSVPDLKMGKDGEPTEASLKALREALSAKAGHNTKTKMSCDAKADENKVIAYAMGVAKNAERAKYNWKPWNANHCRTFSNRAVEAGKKP